MPPNLPTLRRLLRLMVLVAAASRTGAAWAEKPAPRFEADVRPILKAHCFHCHGEEPKPKAKLDLRLARTILKGGLSGAAAEAGSRDGSLLWDRISSDEMPPGDKKLSAAEKEIIGAWIDSGAKAVRSEPANLPPGPVFTEEERSFWSFQPVRRPSVPKVAGKALVRNPVDAFLLAKLEAKGLGFSPAADRRTLIRRVSFDLVGLPPTPEEIALFLKDQSPDAYERMVDRYLDTPAYGERWARHWLDVAGHADSDGDAANDAVRPYAYKYRDYLIRSFNADRPWDELLREQIAGDEMLKPPYKDLSPTDRDRLIATGFLRTAPDATADPGADAVQARDDVVAESIKIVSTSVLGLTVGCAQCHSHRYDPITQEDYFRFRALFEPAYDPGQWRNSSQRLVSLWTEADRAQAAKVDAEVAEIDKKRRAKVDELVAKTLEKEIQAAPEDLRKKLREARETAAAKRTPEQQQLLKSYPRVLVNNGNVSLYDARAFNAIQKEFGDLTTKAKTKRPPEDFVQALTEVPGRIPATKLHYRGNPRQPKDEIKPGELSLLAELTGQGEIKPDDPDVPTSGRRLAYAKRLTSGKHPLTARVLANRLWMHHFGRGIVASPSDFGTLGERPTHPELLDWLADELVAGGWKLKRFHKLMLTSTAYRQASVREAKLDAVDPENRLLGRMSVRRLEAEEVRDAILAASGKLNRTMYGPPLPVAPDESGQVLIGTDTRDTAGRQNGKPKGLNGAEFRRTLYVQIRRSLPLSFTEAFDPPTLTPNCERRANSTVATQSLALMNNEFITEQSEAFADRLADRTDPAAKVRAAWEIAFGVEPTADQVKAGTEFLTAQKAEFASKKDADRLALATFAQALMGSNAFLYVD